MTTFTEIAAPLLDKLANLVFISNKNKEVNLMKYLQLLLLLLQIINNLLDIIDKD